MHEHCAILTGCYLCCGAICSQSDGALVGTMLEAGKGKLVAVWLWKKKKRQICVKMLNISNKIEPADDPKYLVYCVLYFTGTVLQSYKPLKRRIKLVYGKFCQLNSLGSDSFIWFRLTFCNSSPALFPPFVHLWRPVQCYGQLQDVLLLDRRATGHNETLLIDEEVSQLGRPLLTGLLASPGE